MRTPDHTMFKAPQMRIIGPRRRRHGCGYMMKCSFLRLRGAFFHGPFVSWRWPWWPCPAASAYRLRGTGSPETFPARLERMISTGRGSTEINDNCVYEK
uniref:Uncharacterized protein n=1 Tax=Aegilops tauschii subsp. strangulata TaxID=200361 RepID=A0A453LFU3_AEGTS